ncbi:exodeoxyribonuclease III [Candidatus Saccharibacteria bacterium]|nr:exodeoxyribonuclease III [Candidatus Saccharibacteria bacterium]
MSANDPAEDLPLGLRSPGPSPRAGAAQPRLASLRRPFDEGSSAVPSDSLRIFSWNVNGIRAVLRKGEFQKFIAEYQPDVLCLQETKAKQGQAEVDLPDYAEYWNSAERPGYAGTAIFVKNDIKVLGEWRGFTKFEDLEVAGDEFGEPMKEGRVMTVELEEVFVVTVYTPNSKRGLERLKLREQGWDPTFLEYLKRLEKEKPVVVCGDFNAAHTEIDLARPATNHHNAGFTDEERAGIGKLIGAGFVDTFRSLHPEEQRYTWWSHWGHARENNVGWRIDYFFVSGSLLSKVTKAEIFEGVKGSDHCPVMVELKI